MASFTDAIRDNEVLPMVRLARKTTFRKSLATVLEIEAAIFATSVTCAPQNREGKL